MDKGDGWTNHHHIKTISLSEIIQAYRARITTLQIMSMMRQLLHSWNKAGRTDLVGWACSGTETGRGFHGLCIFSQLCK